MGKGATALKKINARVKKLAKRYPGKKRSTLQKQAGKEYRDGKLKVRRKAKPVAKKGKKRVARRKVSAVSGVRRPVRRRARRARRRVGAARPRVVIRTRTKTVRVGRRIGSKKSIFPLLAIGAAGLIAYLVLKPKPAPVLITTASPVRNSDASTILAIANAAGATAPAIAKLIAAINSGNDAQVAALKTAVSSNTVNLTDDSAVQAIIDANDSSASIAGPTRVMGY